MIAFLLVNQELDFSGTAKGLLADASPWSEIDLSVSEDTAEEIKAGVAPATRRAYTHDLTAFERWCSSVGRVAIPATPQTFAEYTRHLAKAGKAPRTIQRALGAIRTAHRAAGATPPDGKAAVLVLRSYRQQRAEAGARTRKAAPAILDVLRALVGGCDATTTAGARDRAIIVLGFAMMARRSELVALESSDVTEVPEGLTVAVRKSKTDQDAEGNDVAVPFGSHPETCPVRLVRAWRELLRDRDIEGGPLFRSVDRHGHVFGEIAFAGRAKSPRMSGESVGLVIARAAERAGVQVARLSAHSLRSGGATEAYRSGADPLAIARHGRWKDGSPVLLGYIRTVDQWRENPMTGVGL